MAKKVTYDNALYLCNLDNVNKEIWDMGQAGYKALLESKAPNKYPYPLELTKLGYFAYFSGARIGEPLRTDRLVCYEKDHNGERIAYIEKDNEKHLSDVRKKKTGQKTELGAERYKKLGKRTITIANIPLNEEYDIKMWDFITNGLPDERGLARTFDVFGGYEALARVSKAFKGHFCANLTDGYKTFDNHGITPHILRHLRAYNLQINRRYPAELIQAYMGWDTADMLSHYVYISKQLKTIGQFQILDSLKK